MPQDASLLIGGPAIVTHNGATIYVEKDIKVKVTKDLRRRSVAGFGSLPAKLDDVKVEITFQPSQFKNLNLLIPYLSTAMGSRIFGNTDLPVVIQSMTEGKKYTFTRGAITKAPKIGLGVKKDNLGEMTITCLKANATELSGAGSVVAIATSSYTDTSFDVTTLFDLSYAIAWGSSPFDAIEAEDGVEVETEYDLAPRLINGAVVDMALTDLRVKASFTPVNLTHANLLTLQNYQAIARGTALAPTNANNLVITGPISGSPLVTLVKAYVADVGVRFSVSDHGSDKVMFEAARTFSSGAAVAVASFSTVA